MKGVEVILEMENSFALYVGKKESRRTEMKEKLQEVLGIERKEKRSERFIGMIRTFFGFRPQGTIEFHMNVHKKVSSDKKTLHDSVGFYPIDKTIYDGKSLSLKARAYLEEINLNFEEFVTQ
jgi:hypothetical protein